MSRTNSPDPVDHNVKLPVNVCLSPREVWLCWLAIHPDVKTINRIKGAKELFSKLEPVAHDYISGELN